MGNTVTGLSGCINVWKVGTIRVALISDSLCLHKSAVLFERNEFSQKYFNIVPSILELNNGKLTQVYISNSIS